MSQVKLQRVLLLGGSGLLGGAVRRVFEPAGVVIDAPSSAECDIRDPDAVRARARDAAPDLLLNCAAQASVDQAEQDPEAAEAINARGAQHVALAAAEAGAAMCQISTDFVFDGQLGQPYREDHPTGEPVNVYGRSKLQGERLARQALPRCFVVRVASLFGAGRRNFVTWVLQEAGTAQPLTIVADRLMSPTWTDDLARQLLALLRTPHHGTYHATGHGVASWYELARAALEQAGQDPAGVIPVPDSELSSPARRPAYSALDNHQLRQRGLDVMQPWRRALARFISPTAESPTKEAP